MASGIIKNPGVNMKLLCTAGPLSSTLTSYNCSETWKNYNILVFNICFYSNVLGTVVRSGKEFDGSTANNRVFVTTATGTASSLFTV